MRIAYLNPTACLGGAETSLLTLLGALRRLHPGWELQLILGAEGPLAPAARQLGVVVQTLPFPDRLARLGDTGQAGAALGMLHTAGRTGRAAAVLLRYGAALRALLADLRPSLIHTNGFKMHALGPWVRPAGTPLVWHLHDYVSPRPLMSRVLSLHARAVQGVIANSRDVAADIRTALGSRVPVHAVYNAVDLAVFGPQGPSLNLDGRCGLPPSDGLVRVGLIGTYARWKGHATFLQALAQLPAGLPVRGYVIGGAVYQTEGSQHSTEELQRLAGELGILTRVGFTGFVTEPAQAVRALDVVVHASTRPEPFGMVIAEAMGCGRALVVSNAGGAGEIVRPETDALAHAPGDAVGLAAQIRRLAESAELRQRLGAAARIAARERFDAARMAAEVSAVYESVWSRSGVAAPEPRTAVGV